MMTILIWLGILVDKQVTTLTNLPKIQKETCEEFIRLLSTVSNCLSVLSTQNIPTDSWDPILVNICTAGLPEKSFCGSNRSHLGKNAPRCNKSKIP